MCFGPDLKLKLAGPACGVLRRWNHPAGVIEAHAIAAVAGPVAGRRDHAGRPEVNSYLAGPAPSGVLRLNEPVAGL